MPAMASVQAMHVNSSHLAGRRGQGTAARQFRIFWSVLLKATRHQETDDRKARRRETIHRKIDAYDQGGETERPKIKEESYGCQNI
jgi:hypothetical protein